MTQNNPLYIGLDLSTQQLKAAVINQNLQTLDIAKVEFEVDLPKYKTKKGVYQNGKEIVAPVAMWLDAIDLVFERLSQNKRVDMSHIQGISGACQQHGTVFWNDKAANLLNGLTQSNAHKTSLAEHLAESLAWKLSPNWQDHSTEEECQLFEATVGGKNQLAQLTGSKAHHRFSGPQILKVKRRMSTVYEATKRISLVSSFVASVLAGKLLNIERSDVCGMNLWDINTQGWNEDLLALLDSSSDKSDIKKKLGPIEMVNRPMASVSKYFVNKYGLNPDCRILPFTGDNSGTILSLPLEANDVIVSLGTSTTALVVTENYAPSSIYHIFNHPIDPKSYMGMLCYCNGSLAREMVRDQVNQKFKISDKSWDKFNEISMNGVPLGLSELENGAIEYKLGFYFPLGEIIPSVSPVTRRVVINNKDNHTSAVIENIKDGKWQIPTDDVVAILESQALSIRMRLRSMMTTTNKLPQRVYFVGGASNNDVICKIMARVLKPNEGSYKLDMADACVIGAASKAVHGCEIADTKDSSKQPSWNEFFKGRWNTELQIVEPWKSEDEQTNITYQSINWDNVLEQFELAEAQLK
ncbi:actin-like ATPase domain-containing protein [Nadsonia fulvescens var. elongata DSM 6958]|uniref:Xylulose kinase n=1 Tax=Nadsonia fulvescens var. elongata DSM 6958 TaxID=857566 RepID=A0A1E3PT40_9ASCO|nr:actin-like ATPase domain-containing protein [Nadsonia fulvescens var. elongata DSM 6958]